MGPVVLSVGSSAPRLSGVPSLLVDDLPAYSWGSGRVTRPFPAQVKREAACVGMGDLMFPDLYLESRQGKRTGEQEALREALTEEAVAVCMSCPVRDPCREWSLEQALNALPVGIYGGLLPEDRAEHYRIMSE